MRIKSIYVTIYVLWSHIWYSETNMEAILSNNNIYATDVNNFWDTFVPAPQQTILD